ncbi:MAG: aspartate/glutamate racemase family protein [Anaerolineae bacterium]
MKTIGLIGGMSWESSAEYYRLINERVRERLGGLHSAASLLYSVDFAELEVLQREARWQEAAEMMCQAAERLQAGGADFIVICANTMHKAADAMQARVRIPLLHIADATAERVKAQGMTRIGLLGTRFTMEEDFYTGRLTDRYGLQVLIPPTAERERVHRVIYDELCLGKINPTSRAEYVEIMEGLVRAGAEGIILGCTEIGLLIHDTDSRVPLFDTTRIHAEAVVDYALAGEISK